jgi:hypothetical protein
MPPSLNADLHAAASSWALHPLCLLHEVRIRVLSEVESMVVDLPRGVDRLSTALGTLKALVPAMLMARAGVLRARGGVVCVSCPRTGRVRWAFPQHDSPLLPFELAA